MVLPTVGLRSGRGRDLSLPHRTSLLPCFGPEGPAVDRLGSCVQRTGSRGRFVPPAGLSLSRRGAGASTSPARPLAADPRRDSQESRWRLCSSGVTVSVPAGGLSCLQTLQRGGAPVSSDPGSHLPLLPEDKAEGTARWNRRAPHPASLCPSAWYFHCPQMLLGSGICFLYRTSPAAGRGFQDCASFQQQVGGRRFLVLSINSFLFHRPIAHFTLCLWESTAFFSRYVLVN